MILTFPKLHRYALGIKLTTVTEEVFELLFMAGNTKYAQKLLILEKASVKLDILKLLIRLSKDTQALDNKKYLILEGNLQEIGKMLGGWIKATKQNFPG